MTVVIGLGTRLDVRMRNTRLENGVLRNGQQPGSAENIFFDNSKIEAMKSLSGWDAACCDEHQFRAKIKEPERSQQNIPSSKVQLPKVTDWSELHILCIHNKDGCKWSGKLGELENHLNTVVHSAAQTSTGTREIDATTGWDSRYEISPYGGLRCDTEGMIIGSFGDEHAPGVKVIPKDPLTPGGSFLPGFRQELETIQSLIRKDSSKTLTSIFIDFPGKESQHPKGEYLQKIEALLQRYKTHEGEECQWPKQEYLHKIEEFLHGCNTPGAFIWYTGHGEEGTGNWCFKDGVITFEEVFDLYKKYFRGKLLGLICDCCFAGHWIQRCGEALDSMGIKACGHQAREHGILMKIGTSCKPNQIAHDTWYTSNGLNLNNNYGRLTFFSSKDVGPTQTSFFVDFTKSYCFHKSEESCRLGRISSTVWWSWKHLTNEDENVHLSERIRIVRGKDQGRPAWHLVIVHEHQYKEFWTAIHSGSLNVADYGHIVFSGWGEDPPAESRQQWITYGPPSAL